MTGGGGVKNHHVPRWVFHVFEQFVKGERFVQAGKDHVGGFDVRFDVVQFFFRRGVKHHAQSTQTAHVAAHVVDRFTDFGQEVGQFGFRVHLQAEKARNSLDLDRCRAEFDVQRI